MEKTGSQSNKFRLITLTLAILFLGLSQNVMSATYYSRATGNWNGSVWSTTSNGTATTASITSSDAVIIQSGNTITVNVAAVCNTLTINAPGSATGITISLSNTLTVSGAITMNAPTSNVAGTIAVGAGTLSAASISITSGGASRISKLTVSTGIINITGNITFGGTVGNAQLTFTGAGRLNLGGSLGTGGTFTASSGMVNFNGSSAQTVPSTYSYYGIASNNTAGVTLTGTESITTLTIGDVTANSVFNDGGYQITSTGTLNLTSGTFNLGSATSATTWPAFTTATNISVGTTVGYISSLAQTVANKAYSNLVLSGAATKTMPGTAMTIIGSLTLSGTVTATLAANVSIGGNLNVGTGTQLDLATFTANRSSAGGTITVAGSMILGGTTGGQTGSNFPTNFSSYTMTGGTVSYDNTTGGQTIFSSPVYNILTLGNTSGTQTAGGNITTTTLNNNTNAADILNMAGYTLSATTVNNSGTIRTQNTSATPLSSGLTWGGTVTYDAGSGGQNVILGTYNNLTLGNSSGINTTSGTVTVNGTLTTTAGGTWNLGTYQLSGTTSSVVHAGILQTQNTSTTPIPSGDSWGGTVQYNATTGGQTVILGTYNNLTLGNSSGTNTTSGNVTVNGTLTTTAGGTWDLGTNQLLGATTSVSNAGTILTQNTSTTPIPSGDTWGGTVQYNATSGGQTVVAGTYGILTLGSTSGTQTAGGNITATTLNNNTNAADILNMGAYTLSATTINNSGTIRTQNTSATPLPFGYTWGGTVTYDASSGGQTIVSGIYGNLTINSSGTQSAGGATTINGTLTLTSGVFSVAGKTITFQTANTPIARTTGTLTTDASTNLFFGTVGNTGGNAFAIPNGTFSSAPTINNLTINRTNSLTLNDQMMSVSGIVLCNGPLTTNGNLTLLSTATQTALIDGSGTGTINGNVTIQRYLSSAFGYKYVSSPVQSLTVGAFSSYVNLAATFPTFYRYDENYSTATNGITTYGWINYTGSGNALSPMAGYAANFGSSGGANTVSISGAVNSGALSIGLTNNNNTNTNGFNLVGNPYPSPISWDASSGWTKSNVDNAIYFFNASGDQYSGTYSSYVNGVGDGPIIAAMQGFFVHVTSGSSGTLGVSNPVRITNSNPTFKDAALDPRIILRFSANLDSKNPKEDVAYLYFDDRARLGFDKDLDALKLTNTDINVPNLYTLTPDSRRLSINGISYPSENSTKIPLGIEILSDGWINFTANDVAQLPNEMYIYLLDTENNTRLDLKQNPVYRFYLKKGKYDQRFSILLSKSSLQDLPSEPEKLFSVSQNGGTMLIRTSLLTTGQGKLYICNILGQIIQEKAVGELESIEINSASNKGIYIVTLVSGKKSYSEKILIQKE